MTPVANASGATSTLEPRPPVSADGREQTRQRRLIWLGAGGLALALVVLGGLVLLSVGQRSSPPPTAAEVPSIKGDERPFKVRPDDPGGLQIPNRDKLIFQRLRGEQATAKVERLLDEPEQPLPPPEAKPAPPSMSGGGASGAVAGGPAPGVDAPAGPAPRESVDGMPVPRPKPTIAATPPTPGGAPSPPAAPPAAAPGLALAPAAAPGGYRIQLGAMRAQAAATTEWQRLTNRHGDLLAGLRSEVSRIDLAERGGVLYRLRAGPLGEAEARRLCGELGRRGVGCVVVVPGG